LPVDQRSEIHRQAMILAGQGAQNDPNLAEFDYHLRPLAGNDFGLTGHGWHELVTATNGTGNTYETSAINATLAVDRYVVIYGVYVASSVDAVSSLRFIVGGARTHQWDLQSVISESPHLLAPEQRRLLTMPSPQNGWIDPVMVPTNTAITMEHYVRGGSAVGTQPVELVLLGIVAERISGGGAGLYGGPIQVRRSAQPL